jgi:hypothetical protein
MPSWPSRWSWSTNGSWLRFDAGGGFRALRLGASGRSTTAANTTPGNGRCWADLVRRIDDAVAAYQPHDSGGRRAQDAAT